MSAQRRSTRNRKFGVVVFSSMACRPDHEWTAKEITNHSTLHHNSVGIGIQELLAVKRIIQLKGEPNKYRLAPDSKEQDRGTN